MNNLYYLPVPNYSYPTYAYSTPTMYSTLPTLQCQESCCGPTPAIYAPVSPACNLSCCTGSAPDIIINNPGNNPVYINNPGSATCTDPCCSNAASSCNLSCCSGGGSAFDAVYGYADTCDKTSSYYYSAGPARAVRYNKTPKSYYESYGKAGCMMM